MARTLIDNTAFAARCATIPGPFGPFTRVGDVPNLDYNSDKPVRVSALTGAVVFDISYDQMGHAESLAAIMQDVFGIRYLLWQVKLAIEVLSEKMKDIAPPDLTQAEQRTMLRILGYIPTLLAMLPIKAHTEYDKNLIPTVNFTATPTGLSTVFADTSADWLTGEYVKLWDFGDGVYSLAAGPTHVYEQDGVYTARLIYVGSQGVYEKRLAVTINAAAPVAAFTATPDTGATPLHVDFTNTTTGATSYEWFIDDAEEPFSTDFEPYHVFTGAATYAVKLVATGPGGTHEVSHNVVVTAG
jgi:PKD repeat protein